MKFMFMFNYRPVEQQEFRESEGHDEGYAAVGQWFGAHSDRLVTTYELQPPQTATRVTFNGAGAPVVTDGPYPEAKEVVGGYAIFELDDAAAAVELARTWPGQGVVEIRPVVDR